MEKKIWLIVVDDHRSGPEYVAASTVEKAEDLMRQILEANYCHGEEFYDALERTKEECIKEHEWQGFDDFVNIVEIELDSPYLVS